MKTSLFRLLAIAAALTFGAGVFTARAEDLATVKSRMSQRLSQLDQLKASGALGENNRGMIELRDGDTATGDVMAAENRDRAIVYAELAKQTGTTPEQVGRARARQIAGASAPGVWLQKPDGTWYKK
ncbi:YdbL family protein [Opitutus terrae]|uniref:DUF1318 domain-containing protein n=1 Tax=Opitutus terrae (strain DSM 11246 / JCM 15787 / PB90-1) TaxID=452637 RepID=B1ZZX8_OPITP|nr:YdbL family protein [Opitutus terrae]ACB77314.1 conserved hypothetical protein [Opitutus terrae PB90-1]